MVIACAILYFRGLDIVPHTLKVLFGLSCGLIQYCQFDKILFPNAAAYLSAELNNDCKTDNSKRLQDLIHRARSDRASGSHARILIPSAGVGCYVLTHPIEMDSNVELFGDPEASFASGDHSTTFFVITGKSNIRLANIVLGGYRNGESLHIKPAIKIEGSRQIELDDIDIHNSTGEINVTSSSFVWINRLKIDNSLQHGIVLDNTDYSRVSDGWFTDEVGFGIILRNGSHDNIISKNTTKHNGIELIGITFGAYRNIVTHNYAEGTGDNGISVTGNNNIVAFNETIGCAGNGIGVYGEWNRISNNYSTNNAQKAIVHSWRAGIAVIPGFGGLATHNIIEDNIIDDDQQHVTQKIGVWLARSTYTNWVPLHYFRRNTIIEINSRLYRNKRDGSSDLYPPSCSRLTCTDGDMTFDFVRNLDNDSHIGDFNYIKNNHISYTKMTPYLNEGVGDHNSLPPQ